MTTGFRDNLFRHLLVAVIVCGFCASIPLFGQATGQITGLVTDPSGGAIAGAAVELISETTGQKRSVISGSDGFYNIPLVNPGKYRVSGSSKGFNTLIEEGIEVVVDGTARVDLRLSVGQVSDQVVVNGAAALVETRNATLGVVIDQEKVVDLPLNGRNFAQLGTLIPGVVAPPSSLGGLNGNATVGGFGNSTGSFNVNGLRNQSNNFQLDGSGNNDSFNSGFVLRPPPDAIEEFKILTHSYGAEYGRNAGSVVNVVTKSGTNSWHGGGWEFNRDDNFQARNFFATTTPTLKQNQYGGDIGGPIKRNKLFVFGYYEGFNNRQGSTSTLTVLSAAQRVGDFSGSAALRDPLNNNAPFAGNIIPSNRISSIATNLLKFVPAPNQPANRLVRSPETTDHRNQFGIRGDYRINDKHALFVRYLYLHTKSFDPLGGSNFSPAGNTAIATPQDVLISDTWTVAPTIINVARFGVNRITAKPNVTSGLDLGTLGFQYPASSKAATGLPFITVSGFFTAGDAQQPFANRQNDVYSFSDDLTWIHGQHSLKFGGEIRRDHIGLTYINRPNGDFTFSGQYTGNAAADFLLGYPIQFRQGSGDPVLDGASFTYSAYAQDEFRVNRRLTLTFGLRYEVNQPFADANDHLAAFHPGQESVKFPAAPTGLVYPGDAGVPRGTYYTDTNNFAPRIAAVLDPLGDGRTSIRAAWGLFYDTVPGQGDFFQNGTLAPPFQPLTQVDFPLAITGSSFANPLLGVGGTPGFPAGITFIGWGKDFTTPVVQHYNVSVQRQLNSHMGFEIGYVGTRGDHLPMFFEVNPTTPILSPAPAIGPRLFPAFGLVRPTFSAAKSWYNALQSSFTMRPWHGVNLLASYTWSHAIDDVSGLNIGGESRPVLPVIIGNQASIDAALTREQGNALFDVRHRFVISFGYELPTFAASAKAIRATLGDWAVNGIVQKQTGFPFTVIEPNNVSLTSLTNRPNQICNANVGGAQTPTQWFNPACFQRLTIAANAGQLGNEGRNTVFGPGFTQVDVSVFKNIRITERQRAQLRFEAFNVMNHAHFNNPGATLGSPTFDAITSAADGRVLQMAAKYSF